MPDRDAMLTIAPVVSSRAGSAAWERKNVPVRFTSISLRHSCGVTSSIRLPAPMPATASVSAVDLGNAVGADMRVTAPMSSFAPKDTIYAAVSTATSDPAATVPGKLGVKWTHVDSNQTVHEESRDIGFAGSGVTDFQISKPDGWPTGKYKLEVSLDGSVVQTREFEVK